MKDFTIGILVSAAIIIFLESFKSLDKRLLGAFTLVGIPFIYVGFAWSDLQSLVIVVISVIVFLALSYYGQTKNVNLIVFGLALHGVWDLVFPRFSSVVPKGYDIFCLTVDFILAGYFYFRLNKIGAIKLTTWKPFLKFQGVPSSYLKNDEPDIILSNSNTFNFNKCI